MAMGDDNNNNNSTVDGDDSNTEIEINFDEENNACEDGEPLFEGGKQRLDQSSLDVLEKSFPATNSADNGADNKSTNDDDLSHSDASFSASFDITNDSILDDLSSCKRTLENEEREKLAVQTEVGKVCLLRIFVVLVLILSAVGCSIAVYYNGELNRQKNFETQFTITAQNLFDSFHEKLQQKLAAADAFGVTLTSYALQQQTTTTTNNSYMTLFPNVTLPNIVIQGSINRVLAEISSGSKNNDIMMNWLPLVTDSTRKQWEAYSTANQHWIDIAHQEEMLLRERQQTRFSDDIMDDTHFNTAQLWPLSSVSSSASAVGTTFAGGDGVFHDQIFQRRNNEAEPEGSGPYLPLWQFSPVLPMKDVLNMNLLSHPAFSESLGAALASEKVVLSPTLDLRVVNSDEDDDSNGIANLYYCDSVIDRSYTTTTTAIRDTATSSGNDDAVPVVINPATNIIYPVFTNFDYTTSDSPSSSRIAGMIMISLYWSLLFENILPEGMDGYICVLENVISNQTYTYQVNGPDAQFLGHGDLHDTQYDSIQFSDEHGDDIIAHIARCMQQNPERWSYTSVELLLSYEHTLTNYKLTIYPSQQLEEKCQKKNEPIIFSVIIGCIFLFTIIMFIIYDVFVERRQKLVMNQAVASNALISSLFPENVRDRLLFEDDNISTGGGGAMGGNSMNSSTYSQNRQHHNRTNVDSTNHTSSNSEVVGGGTVKKDSLLGERMSSMNSDSLMGGGGERQNSIERRNSGGGGGGVGRGVERTNSGGGGFGERRNSGGGRNNIMAKVSSVVVSPITTFAAVVAASNQNQNQVDCSQSLDLGLKPIADFFPCTTIMFGDLAGFTAWSADRKPEEVFELLEALYSAFDTIAMRRKVFKVETIGDCYVAVTGLPEPQEDHAIIMCKFARDCIHKMKEIVTQLKYSLGEETAQLDMRVGLHSGSVTAGVLRGQKSRFQLFGDAMNTASRIETNGMAGRIHISQETADLLIGADKVNWVIAREDKIFAKGKGEMQTYWIDMENIRRRNSCEP